MQRVSKMCHICASANGSSGASSPTWKGGKTKHKEGYLMVRMPTHPRARTVGYVFEHILVMESTLGRMLVAGETVHHVNGVRDDNRAENLELWCKPQPSGVRAADALAWAREILRLYG